MQYVRKMSSYQMFAPRCLKFVQFDISAGNVSAGLSRRGKGKGTRRRVAIEAARPRRRVTKEAAHLVLGEVRQEAAAACWRITPR